MRKDQIQNDFTWCGLKIPKLGCAPCCWSPSPGWLLLTWLIVAYDDDSGRVVGGDEDGGDGGRGGVNVNVCADGSGGVDDGSDDIGVKDNVGGNDCKGYWWLSNLPGVVDTAPG